MSYREAEERALEGKMFISVFVLFFCLIMGWSCVCFIFFLTFVPLFVCFVVCLLCCFQGFLKHTCPQIWFSGMEVNENILSRSQGARQRWRRRLKECSLWWRAIVSGWSSLAETTRSYYFCHRVCKIWFTCKGTIEFSKGIFNEYQLFSGLLTTSVATAVGKWRLLFSSSCLPRYFAWSSTK